MDAKKRIELLPAKPVIEEKTEETPDNATYRFTLSLQLPTNDSCSEFSYVKLLKDAKSKEVLNKKDPFASVDKADDDKLASIAKEFEEKYGNTSYAEEYVDLGDGYDTNDSFIDNAEAYDELVPSCLTTKLGGFYINSGVLDFKEVADKMQKKKKKKKSMMISSDNESSTSEFKSKLPKVKHGDIKSKKRKRSLDDVVKLSKKTKNKDLNGKAKLKESKKTKSVSELVHGSPFSGMSKVSQVEGTALSGIESVIESVVKNSMLMDADSLEDSQDNTEAIRAPPNPELVPKLPENLAPNLMQNIECVKKAAAECTTGKGKFFTPAINQTLLEIDKLTRHLTSMNRSMIYSHMSAFLPCGKETLLKRVKKLRQNELDDKLKEPMQTLKEAIDQEMPQQIEKHVQENLVFVQHQQQGKPQDGVNNEVAASQTESDDEGKTNQEEPEKEAEGSSKKKPRGPAKKFEWTEKIRNLTCRVIALKMSSFELAKNKGQTAEDYIKAFLEAEVRPLWPKGWMQTRTLFKETRAAHAKWTNPSSKLKKVALENRSLGTTSHPQPTQPKTHVVMTAKVVQPATTQNASKPTVKPLKVLDSKDPVMQSFSTLLDYAEGKMSAADTEALENLLSPTAEPGNQSSIQKPSTINQDSVVKKSQPLATDWAAEFSKYVGGDKSTTKGLNPQLNASKSHSEPKIAKQKLQKPVSQGVTVSASDLMSKPQFKQTSPQERLNTFQQQSRKLNESLITSPMSSRVVGGTHGFGIKHPTAQDAMVKSKQSSLANQSEALMRSKSMLNYQTGHSLLKTNVPQHSQQNRAPKPSKSIPKGIDDIGLSTGQPDITGLSLGQIQQLYYSSSSPGANVSANKEFFPENQSWMKNMQTFMPNYQHGSFHSGPKSPGYHHSPTTPPISQAGMHARKSPGYHDGASTSPINQASSMSAMNVRKSPENSAGYRTSLWNSMNVSPTSQQSSHVARNLLGHGSPEMFMHSDSPEHLARQYPPYQSRQQYKDGRPPESY